MLQPLPIMENEIISDRDTRWTSTFWKEICKQMEMKRALTTAYHPQVDEQTDESNFGDGPQGLCESQLGQLGLLLAPFVLAYNNLPHSSTTFSPSFLLLSPSSHLQISVTLPM
jgi:hypothetical protein